MIEQLGLKIEWGQVKDGVLEGYSAGYRICIKFSRPRKKEETPLAFAIYQRFEEEDWDKWVADPADPLDLETAKLQAEINLYTAVSAKKLAEQAKKDFKVSR